MNFYTNIYSLTEKYYCFDDCKQSGCDGHELKIIINDTSGSAEIQDDGKYFCEFDSSKAQALFNLLEKFKD